MSKKGVSGVVTALLLILVALVAVTIVGLVIKGYIEVSEKTIIDDTACQEYAAIPTSCVQDSTEKKVKVLFQIPHDNRISSVSQAIAYVQTKTDIKSAKELNFKEGQIGLITIGEVADQAIKARVTLHLNTAEEEKRICSGQATVKCVSGTVTSSPSAPESKETTDLIIEVSPKETGEISFLDKKCENTCTFKILKDETLTFTAQAKSGKKFKEWTKDCTGTSPICTIKFDSNKAITAEFEDSSGGGGSGGEGSGGGGSGGGGSGGGSFTPPIRTNGLPSGDNEFKKPTIISLNTDINSICRFDTVAGKTFENLPIANTFLASADGKSHTFNLGVVEKEKIKTYYIKCQDKTNPTNVNIDDYQINFRLLDVVTLNSCSELKNPNRKYILGKNLKPLDDTTCLEITNENITLDCAGYTLKNDDSIRAHAISVTSKNVEIKNCNISLGGYTFFIRRYNVGINLSKASNIKITNSTISKVNHAVYSSFSSNLDVINNTFDYAGNRISYPIYLINSSNISIKTNFFATNAIAIRTANLTNSSIINNSFNCLVTGSGIYDETNSNNVIIINNSFRNCTDSIIIYGSNIEIKNNDLFNSTISGIIIKAGQNATVSYNKIKLAPNHALDVMDFVNATIYNNEITPSENKELSWQTMYLYNVNLSNITKNIIKLFPRGEGLILVSSYNNVIDSNEIENSNIYGLRLSFGSSKNIISNNKIENNKLFGIYLEVGSKENTFNNNIAKTNIFEDCRNVGKEPNTFTSNLFTKHSFCS